jgi:hypothetical protein
VRIGKEHWVMKLREIADELDTSEILHFAGEKMDQKFYWWDAMVLLRKLALVLVGSLAVTSGGSNGGGAGVTTCWYIGSGVVVVVSDLFTPSFHSPAYCFSSCRTDCLTTTYGSGVVVLSGVISSRICTSLL